MPIPGRIKNLIAFTGLSVRAFAIKIGMSQTTLDKQLKGLRGVSLETITAILYSFPDVSSEWLLRGNGEMIISDEPKDQDRVNILLDTIATLQQTINAKSDTISALAERVSQLENQLKSK